MQFFVKAEAEKLPAVTVVVPLKVVALFMFTVASLFTPLRSKFPVIDFAATSTVTAFGA